MLPLYSLLTGEQAHPVRPVDGLDICIICLLAQCGTTMQFITGILVLASGCYADGEPALVLDDVLFPLGF